MPRVFLSDLSHTTAQGLTSEFIPYGVGCLKSYYLAHGAARDRYQIRLFQDPEALIAAWLADPPEVLAFSNYSWNRDLSYAIAAEAKRRRPETLVVFGGPNYPLEDPVRLAWLEAHPAVDVYVIGEGEAPFTALLDRYDETGGDLEAARRSGIEGCHALLDGELVMSSDVTPRLASLDLFPSPYAAGYLDEFLANPKLIPLTETNRGCPFLCTFCEKGVSSWNKMTRGSLDRFAEEVDYIARHTGSSFLLLADNNFGMFKEDAEAARIMTRAYREHGYPLQVYSATGKSRYDRVLEAIQELEGRMPVTVSVQSLDPGVLENIKRKNLPLENLIEVSQHRYSDGTRSRSEVILGLPGDTREKHIASLSTLVDAGVSFLLAYTLILLDGSELGTRASRSQWKMETKFRLNHRCFGNYQFGDTRLRAAEIEEVVVALDGLTEEDYHACRQFYLAVGLFYMDEILFELYEFLKCFHIRPSEFLRQVHENGRRHFSPGLTELVDSFAEATRRELWPTREVLEEYMQAADRTIDDVREMGGFNVIYHHRAWAFSELVPDIVAAAFEVAREMLPADALDDWSFYLDELRQYMILRKRNVFDYETVSAANFHYDFAELDARGFVGLPGAPGHDLRIEMFHTDEQKRIFGAFNPGREGAARTLAKLCVPRMYRTLRAAEHGGHPATYAGASLGRSPDSRSPGR